ARKSGDAEGVAQAEALIDFRIDPDFGTPPQPKAEIGGGVPALAALVGIETMRTEIGTAERKGILLKKRRLAVAGENVGFERRGRGGVGRFGGGVRRIAIKPVVEAEAQLAQCQVGREALRAGRERDGP